jgi:ketopantoate reductase
MWPSSRAVPILRRCARKASPSPAQRLVFGEFDGRVTPRAERFLEAFRAGGVNVELAADIRREIWQKFVFLVGLSGTTTTTRSTIGPIRENPQTRQFLLDLMREVSPSAALTASTCHRIMPSSSSPLPIASRPT